MLGLIQLSIDLASDNYSILLKKWRLNFVSDMVIAACAPMFVEY